MKELIKELLNQALEPSGLEGLGGSYMEVNQEKFVELLCENCVRLLKKKYPQDDLLSIEEVQKFIENCFLVNEK